LVFEAPASPVLFRSGWLASLDIYLDLHLGSSKVHVLFLVAAAFHSRFHSFHFPDAPLCHRLSCPHGSFRLE